MFYKFIQKTIKIVPVFMVVLCVSAASAGTFLDFVGSKESQHTSNAFNPANGGMGAMGEFQQRDMALEDTGYLTKSSNGTYTWTGKNGVNSKEDYLNCSSCQYSSETQFLKDSWSQLQNNGATSYIGKTGADGVTYNEGALIECAQQLGAAGCKSYIETGQCGGQTCDNPHLAQDIALASGVDASEITNSQNTQVDNSGLASGGSISSGTALAGIETACAKEVADALKDLGQQEVNGAQLLATQPGTGFTTANGKSPLSGDGSMDGRNPFSVASCLDSLRPGLGVNMIFGQASNLISNTISQAKSSMCSALQSTVNNLTSPIYNAVSNGVSSGMSYLDSLQPGGALGGYLPSVGSLVNQSGFSVNATQTTLGNSGLNVNGKNYGGSPLTQGASYAGMGLSQGSQVLSNVNSGVNIVQSKLFGYMKSAVQ